MSVDQAIQILEMMFFAAFGGFVFAGLDYGERKNLFDRATGSSKPSRFPFIFWPLASAVIALMYWADGSILRPYLAFILGLTTPTTLKATLSKKGLGPPPENES